MKPVRPFALVTLLSMIPACSQPPGAPTASQADEDGKADDKPSAKAKEAAPSPAASAQAAAPGGKDEGKGGGDKRGEVQTWKRSQLAPNSSKLMVGDKESLALRAIQVKARIDGFRARVLIDYSYANEGAQQLEGTFKLRLPNGASPYFFAFGETAVLAGAGQAEKPQLWDFEHAREMGVEPAAIMAERKDAWAQPKEARMVPREKAAIAYGDTVRQRVDPALVEWSGAGVFSARVFPLAPHKVHRIVVGYDVDLIAAGDDLVLALDLPQDVPFRTVDLDIARPAGATIHVSQSGQEKTESGRAFHRIEQPQDSQITVKVSQAEPWLLAGGEQDTGSYFATQFEPAVPTTRAEGENHRAVLVVDTSLSQNPDLFNVWRRLSQAILDDNRDRIDEFAVLFFNVEQHWWRTGFTDNTAANVAAFAADADALALEGATDLGAALGEAATLAKGADVFLLSDGAATWGDDDLYAMSHALTGSPLFAYRTGFAGSDEHALEHLGRETGGAVFSVVGESEIAKAATAHRARPWHIDGVSFGEASDLLLAGRPTSVFPGQRLTLVGRGAPGAKVKLTLSQGARKEVIEVPVADAVPSALAPRAFGTIAVTQLEDFERATEELALAYATHFRVTGETCSLLMLESEADYQRHGIDPVSFAGAVKGSDTQKAIRAAEAQLGAELGDPRAAFLGWLGDMQRAEGYTVRLPAQLTTALGSLPRERFSIAPERLAITDRTRAALPETFLARLAKRDIEYDAFVAEANRRKAANGSGDALKALSSLVEQSPGDGVLARDVAFFAMQEGEPAQAYHLLRRVADARPHEPQTYMALARAAARAGRPELAVAYYEVGLGGAWDGRFGDFHAILEVDYLRMLRTMPQDSPLAGYAEERLQSLSATVGKTEADVMVVIMWNTDNTDVDLHVTEPSGEECFYSHPTTQSGGRLTRDVTRGYGPEMFMLPQAPQGTYTVRAKYFASDRNRASARTKVHALVFENWGRPDEKLTEKVVTLELGKDMHDIATFTR